MKINKYKKIKETFENLIITKIMINPYIKYEFSESDCLIFFRIRDAYTNNTICSLLVGKQKKSYTIVDYTCTEKKQQHYDGIIGAIKCIDKIISRKDCVSEDIEF